MASPALRNGFLGFALFSQPFFLLQPHKDFFATNPGSNRSPLRKRAIVRCTGLRWQSLRLANEIQAPTSQLSPGSIALARECAEISVTIITLLLGCEEAEARPHDRSLRHTRAGVQHPAISRLKPLCRGLHPERMGSHASPQVNTGATALALSTKTPL